ncbi:ThiF family adenylyltransferase [Micromonospora zamorensis]|uniref:ThiF family adenylyltransferase n=1 Tax=Micromonospora zamorensis TaxID=709883 RepID=A0ABZ1PCF8_9ACTN
MEKFIEQCALRGVLAGRVEASGARQTFNSCDWIFLAADSHSARYWVNGAANQYRFIAPGSGCMWCNGLILAIDMQPERVRAAAPYVAGVPAPSVIALNGFVATEAINHAMLAVTGMHHDPEDATSTIHLRRRCERTGQMPRRDEGCSWCSQHGHLGRGEEGSG